MIQRKDFQEMIKRLRDEETEDAKNRFEKLTDFEAGEEAGDNWATNLATTRQLKSLQEYFAAIPSGGIVSYDAIVEAIGDPAPANLVCNRFFMDRFCEKALAAWATVRPYIA